MTPAGRLETRVVLFRAPGPAIWLLQHATTQSLGWQASPRLHAEVWLFVTQISSSHQPWFPATDWFAGHGLVPAHGFLKPGNDRWPDWIRMGGEGGAQHIGRAWHLAATFRASQSGMRASITSGTITLATWPGTMPRPDDD